MIVMYWFSFVEEEQNDTQCDQPHKAVVAQYTEQTGDVGYNTAKEGWAGAKEDLHHYCERNQQQGDLSYLREPSLYMLEKVHTLLLKKINKLLSRHHLASVMSLAYL